MSGVCIICGCVIQVRGIICGSELPSCSKIIKVTIKQTPNSELFDERSLLITYNRAQTRKIIKYITNVILLHDGFTLGVSSASLF